MAVRVRLTRVGNKKNPIWRVVVADSRSPRDGRCIETVGHYNPQTEPSTIVLDHERLKHWIDRGAQPSGTVKKLMRSGSASGAAAEQPAEAVADQPSETDEQPAEQPAEAAGEQPAEPASEQPEPDAEPAGDAS